MLKNEAVVVRKSPRFQLEKREIDQLVPTGIYHFIANSESGYPIEYKAMRYQLEEVFAQAMATPSYCERGLFHQHPWPLAEQFRVSADWGEQ